MACIDEIYSKNWKSTCEVIIDGRCNLISTHIGMNIRLTILASMNLRAGADAGFQITPG